MRVISRRRLREHWQLPGRRDSEAPLRTWFDVARKAEWAGFEDVKVDYGKRVDIAHGKFVFDVHGNSYRIVCLIDFRRHGVLVLWVGNHAEYDELCKNNGKKLKAL